MAKSVVSPNLGLYYDRPKIALGPKQLQAGRNFRIRDGRINNLNLGWNSFNGIQLNGPVLLIDNFVIRDQAERLIFATPTDLYALDGTDVVFITPVYVTGTASRSGSTVTGIGTTWLTNARIGDEISFGSNAQNDPAATWHLITNVGGNTTLTTQTSGTVVSGNYTIRRKFTGDILDQWQTAIFVNAAPEAEDQWWATNGIDSIIRWNGIDLFVEEMSATLGFTAKTLAVYSNMMIYANLVQGGTAKPTDMINSNVGEPANVSSGLSEQFKVHGNTDGVITMYPIGDTLAFYSSRTVTIAQFVGDPLIFIFRNAINGLGVLAGRAVADYGDYHEFLGPDSQYRFDGVTVQEVNGHVWREILRQQDPARVGYSFAHFDEENGDLLWVVPSTVDPGSGNQDAPPSRAFAQHYLEEVGDRNPDPYSMRDFPFTAVGYYERLDGLTWDQISDQWQNLNFRWNDQFFFAAFPLNLTGDIDGNLYTLNTSQNDANNGALPSYVKFGRTALVDGKMRALISRVYPFVDPFTTPLDVTVYMSDHAMGQATITHTESFDQTLPQGGHFVSPYRRGRFVELEFSTDGPSTPYQISGYDFDVKGGGRR
jgi:hypothetical protein